MRNVLLPLFLFYTLSATSQNFRTQFEQSGGTESPTYPAIIRWWKALDAAYPQVKMMEMGPTDAGFPLHLILVSTARTFDIKAIKQQKKNIIFINNGIHPGEPDGIDASMLLVRDIVQGKYSLPSNIVLAFIPVYNIGGALNRSANYRIDQNGPVEKGFRGNAQNLDLNRDFIKMDSKNAVSFARIFHYLDPDVFVDNHVSNGADYQHVMTLLVSQHNKLGGVMGEFMSRTFEPGLYPLMKKKGFDLVPYVNHFGETPDKGWPEFWDSPRYGSGYGTLWNTFSFVPETHMLKPYKQRVEATKALMESFIEFTELHGKEITSLREATQRNQQQQTTFPLAWKWDRTKSTTITFKGFESGMKKSEVSGIDRLYYDRTKPYEKQIPFFNTYIDTFSVTKPKAYLIPQGWWKVIERLQANGVQMQRLEKDTILDVEAYRIEDYKSGARPYEGHHVNSNVQVAKTTKKVALRKGDYYISLNQPGIRFLIETLEPQAEDSYFAWNFFDPILGQKEGYSDYVFEETAAGYLKTHPDLKQKMADRLAADSTFRKNGSAQLNFVFQNSSYYEPAHMTYPVYRLTK
ncbi:M14 family metallopeptidase [Flavisolibacter nicotianae]|uniref:M14 family metallopeptidase n=1 Tax=Flavisolibacter nicotianae TaxID=2364882 RepID=UPI000EB28513|nr:M14 family metallopeptidase [Flavisolibacter nicotianae]